MAEGMRERLRNFEGWRTAADEYRELDDERVLVLTNYSGRGKASGLELGQMRTKGANLLYVRGGKVIRLIVYWDRHRAFADLGLALEGGSAESP